MKIIIKDLSKGQDIKGQLCITDYEVRQGARGPFAKLTLTDGKASITGMRWNCSELLETGKIVDVIGTVEKFNGNLQLNLKRCFLNTEVDIRDFTPIDTKELKILKDQLMSLVLQIKDSEYQTLVNILLEEYMSEFFINPGAKKVHHDYSGGLLKHTIETTELAISIGNSIIKNTDLNVNMDLVITAAILHDIGKCFTLNMEGLAPQQTDDNFMFEHLYLGARIVETVAIQNNISIRKINKVVHCILAHHGKLEYGSPVTPKTIEAYIVHRADLISADCAIWEKALNTSTDRWIKNYYLGGYLYNASES